MHLVMQFISIDKIVDLSAEKVAIIGIQLLVLFGLLVLQMAFPRQMEQLGWASGRKMGASSRPP